MKLFLFLSGFAMAAALPRHDIERAVRGYINAETKKTDGQFLVDDKVMHRVRRLTLSAIPNKRIVSIEDGHALVCADFRDKNGDRVDVDFYLTHDRIEKIQIHRVNGKLRQEE